MAPAWTIIDLLGGRKVLGTAEDVADVRTAIRQGLPFAALENLAGALELTQDEATEAVGMARRTLARRKRQRQLSPAESDRVYRIARITQLAADVLGALDKARVWLVRPNRALAGSTPLSILDTEIGARQVEELLLHINYGIYA
jgi:putative toxin-antitoxin system antitoxin component (TIGR02293 family)